VEYVDRPDIEIRDEEGKVVKGETIEMPFKYVKDKETGKAIMPEGMLKLLGRDADKGILDLL
jgi:ribosome biogenesis SPOUT family RNA methylase Rps3